MLMLQPQSEDSTMTSLSEQAPRTLYCSGAMPQQD